MPIKLMTSMFQSSVLPEDIERLELAAFGGKITIIDKPGPELEHAIAYLRRQKIIGFDTESRPCFSPSQPKSGVALLQLSGPREAFLFRIQHLGMEKRLCRILSDEKIIKVGAAVHDDIRGLQKYEMFEPCNFVDLQKIVWEYGIKDKSVKKMSAIILGVRISKTQQLSNWEAEVLSESQQLYAATDAWVCREMYNVLMKSEKHPLTPEEMMPSHPPVLPQKEEKAAEGHAPEQKRTGRRRKRHHAHAAGVQGAAESSGTRKSSHGRRRYYRNRRKNRKRNTDNGKDNTEKR